MLSSALDAGTFPEPCVSNLILKKYIAFVRKGNRANYLSLVLPPLRTPTISPTNTVMSAPKAEYKVYERVNIFSGQSLQIGNTRVNLKVFKIIWNRNTQTQASSRQVLCNHCRKICPVRTSVHICSKVDNTLWQEQGTDPDVKHYYQTGQCSGYRAL